MLLNDVEGRIDRGVEMKIIVDDTVTQTVTRLGYTYNLNAVIIQLPPRHMLMSHGGGLVMELAPDM